MSPESSFVRITVLAGLALVAGQALGWGDVATQVWVERSQRIATAVDQSIQPGADLDESSMNARKYLAGIVEACAGLTGEIIKNGGKNTPVWAQTAQQHMCLGTKNLSRAFEAGKKDKGYCRDLDSAADYARKARPGEDPDSIVEAAARLAAAAEKLGGTPIELVKKSLLGDSSITFKCRD
jgi:hypothetical protein